MNIAIIGAGNVGGTLGRIWAQRGHAVTFGVRDPSGEKIRLLLDVLPVPAKADSIAAATAHSEVVVLSTPWSATEAAIVACGDLTGKIVIDCTNPLAPDLSGLTIGHDFSGGEQVAEWAKGAFVYKAFNQTGFNIMADPVLDHHKTVMFVCGDDEERKPIVLELVKEIGFEAIEVGKLSTARLLEPLALLWIQLAYAYGQGRNFGFAIVRR